MSTHSIVRLFAFGMLETRRIGLMAVLATIGCLSAASLFAQSSGGDFEITTHTIDAGGGTSTAPEFELSGTIGQADANRQQSSGGEFVLAGGFWANAQEQLFADGFESN